MNETRRAAAGVKLSAIDLNLLVVFDAVMQDRSVTRAGKRVGLSQPAMSHALIRLRHMLKDELFVRSPKGMIPTPRAEQLAVPVRRALDDLQRWFEPDVFDASTTTRTFRIAVDNYAAIVLVGALASRLIGAAPHVTIDFRPSGTLDLEDLLDRAVIDLAIGPFPEQGERFSRQGLMQDEFVAVLRKNHPATATRELALEKFASIPHLEISSVHHSTDFIDRVLIRRNLKRRVVLRAPFLSAVRILAVSDMISVFPKRIAEELVRYRPLVIRPLAHSSPIIETAMIWPRRLDNQSAHCWVRESVTSMVNSLGSN